MKKNTWKRPISLGTRDLNTVVSASDFLPVQPRSHKRCLVPCFPRWRSPWQSSGKPRNSSSTAVAVGVRVPGAWSCRCLPMRRHSSRALVCPRELHPTPFMSYKGHLQNCVMETELLVSECQAGCGERGANFLCSLWTHHWGAGSGGLQTDLDTLFKSATAVICSM